MTMAEGSTPQSIAARHRVNERIPPYLFRDILDDNDKVVVTLEHLDYYNRACGMSSPYRFAAKSVAKLDIPISSLTDLRSLSGVASATKRIIEEILETGASSQLERFAVDEPGVLY